MRTAPQPARSAVQRVEARRNVALAGTKKVRVLFLIDNLRPGGAQKALLALARAVKESGGEPEVWCLGGSSPVQQSFQDAGIPVLGGAEGIFGVIAAPFALMGHLVRRKTDIVQTFLFHSDVTGRVIGRVVRLLRFGAGRPIIISSVRASNIRNRWWQFLLLRLTAWMADAFTTVSQRTLDFAESREGVRRKRASVIPNGIDPADYDVSREDARKRLELAPDDFVVASVGRLHEQKGYEFLLPAVRNLLQDLPNSVFLIAGYGPLEEQLKDRARELNVASHVRFLGYRRDVPDILAACDLYVLPSLWEGMSNAVLEAMAAARPVIATAVDGNVEQVSDGETGLLAPPADSDALTEAIRRLSRDRELAARMGRKGRETVEQKFSLSAMTSAYLALYRRLLGESKTK
jgi:glycosyltransferase involved in cell wall biosynthesis